MITIGEIEADRFILPPECGISHRSRSVAYSLDGSAHEDRLGGYKKTLTVTFGLLPQLVWENLKSYLQEKVIPVSGNVGSLDVSGNYRMKENGIPTPVLVVIDEEYYCRSFSISLEEI